MPLTIAELSLEGRRQGLGRPRRFRHRTPARGVSGGVGLLHLQRCPRVDLTLMPELVSDHGVDRSMATPWPAWTRRAAQLFSATRLIRRCSSTSSTDTASRAATSVREHPPK